MIQQCKFIQSTWYSSSRFAKREQRVWINLCSRKSLDQPVCVVYSIIDTPGQTEVKHNNYNNSSIWYRCSSPVGVTGIRLKKTRRQSLVVVLSSQQAIKMIQSRAASCCTCIKPGLCTVVQQYEYSQQLAEQRYSSTRYTLLLHCCMYVTWHRLVDCCSVDWDWTANYWLPVLIGVHIIFTF